MIWFEPNRYLFSQGLDWRVRYNHIPWPEIPSVDPIIQKTEEIILQREKPIIHHRKMI